ncbi:MAG TPA: hypothetical protein VGF92_05680 [Stellaceae bacterium]|jgi:hypothetical protein
MGDPKGGDRRAQEDFYKKPGGGLIDPQGEPPREETGRKDDETTEPTEELPSEGLAKKSPEQDLSEKPRHRGG